MADKKSNPAQIAQAVLDDLAQAIKVSVTNTSAIPVDIQDTEIAISIDKDEDSVTIYAPDNNTTPIPVDVLTLPAPLDVTGEGEAATALRVHLSDETLTALGSPTVNVEITDVDVTSVPAPLNVTGPGVASAALRVQLADESLAALENISVTVTNTALEITNDAGNPIPVSGTVNANTGLLQPLTDAQLRASAVPVSAAALPLPSGASTEAKQNSQITELQAIKGHVDQVEAKLDTLITQTDGVEGSLTSIDNKTPTIGQALMAGSSPVVLASNHSAILVYQQALNTYAAGITNLTPGATPTDIATITGSAGKVIKVRKIHISGIATNNTQLDVFLIKRSTQNTGGTSATPTVVPYDSLNPAGTAVVRSYTANPTALGSAVGTISQSMLFVTSATNVANNNYIQGGNYLEIDFVDSTMQPLTLRGVNEVLAINLNGVTLPAGLNLEIDMVWTEE